MLTFRRKARGRRHRAEFAEPLERRTLLATVTVNSSAPLQTIESIGGNYALGQYVPHVQDAIGKYTLTNLNPKHVRVPLLVTEFEPANDNTDSNSINWAGFKDTGKVHDMFLFLKDLQAQGRVIHGAVFNAPNWMVTSGTTTRYNQRVLGSDKYNEMIESIAAYLKYAKDNYGVNISTVSINEADGGYRVLLTAGQYADLVKKGGAKFASMGLNVKWVIGDSYYTQGADDYARNILAVSGVRQYAAAISYHSWWSEDLADSEWKKLADLGKQHGLPVWANETGFWALANKQDPGLLATWSAAMRLAKVHNKVLRLSAATQLLYWQYQKDFDLLTIDSAGKVTLRPIYYIIKTLVDNLQPGSQLLSTSSDDGSVLPLGGKDTARNRFMAQAINTSSSSKTVTFKGLPNQTMTLVRDSGSDRSKVIGSYAPVNGQLTFTFPASSVNTLVGKLGAGSSTLPPSPPPPPNSPPPPPASPPPPPSTVGLPSGWASADVGEVGKGGSASFASAKGVYELSGAGYDIGGLADSFQYVYKSLAGDGEIIARITAIENTNISAKASVMVRNSLSAKSKEASLSLTPANGLWLQTRKTTRGNSGAVDMGNTVAAPQWLKVQRSGDMFIFFRSPDGSNWTQIAKSTIDMNESVLVGLAVTSRDTTELNSSFFDHVSVNAGAQAQALPASLPVGRIASQNFVGARQPIVKSIFNSGEAIEEDSELT